VPVGKIRLRLLAGWNYFAALSAQGRGVAPNAYLFSAKPNSLEQRRANFAQLIDCVLRKPQLIAVSAHVNFSCQVFLVNRQQLGLIPNVFQD